MLIMAIDPGETTGFVVVDTDTDHVLTFGVWKGPEDFMDASVQNQLSLSEVLVVEDYRIYPHKARQHIGSRPYAIEVIGHIRLWAYAHSRTVEFQSASQAKQQWPNKRLAKHFTPTHLQLLGGRHAKDALRHALTYIENKTDHGLFFSAREVL